MSNTFCEDDEEISFCFVGSTNGDDNATEDVEELHENVWFKMKPPRESTALYTPAVTARQIDLVRALLTGKNSLKTEGRQLEADISKAKKKKPPRRDISPEEVKVSLKAKKSSVKYLDKIAKDQLLNSFSR